MSVQNPPFPKSERAMKWIVFENPKGLFWIRRGLSEQGLMGDANLREYVDQQWEDYLAGIGQWASYEGPFATRELAEAAATARR